MTIMQVQARIHAAHGRFAEAIAGLTKIVEFFDGRQMAVAPLARALNFRADAYLGKGDADAALADARVRSKSRAACRATSPGRVSPVSHCCPSRAYRRAAATTTPRDSPPARRSRISSRRSVLSIRTRDAQH